MNLDRASPDLIAPDSLQPHLHLGVGFGVRFRSLRFLLRHQPVLAQPIQAGRLLLAVWCDAANPTCNPPEVARMDRSRVAVLRAQEMEGWPERGTHEWATVESWLQHADPATWVWCAVSCSACTNRMGQTAPRPFFRVTCRCACL